MTTPSKALQMTSLQIHVRSVIVTGLIGIVAAVVMTAICQNAVGQKFTALKVADKYRTTMPRFDASAEEKKAIRFRDRPAIRAISEDSRKVDDILRNNGNIADPIIAEFFDGYVFPSMTLLDNRVISKLGERRTKYIKSYLNPRIQGDVRNGMIDFTIAGMEKVCGNPDLHPAARLNAVYLIGMIDQTPMVRLENRAPVPSKAAFSSLVKILDSQDDASHPGYLKVAALAGIQRHVEIDSIGGGKIPDADKQALLEKINLILNKPETDELSYWLKRRSMQVIGLIGDPGSVDTAIAILRSEGAGIWLKFDAMEAIGKLKLGSDTTAKNDEATVAIVEFLTQSLENESKSIEASVAKLVFDNLLFQDLDLIATGTNYEYDSAVPTNESAGGGGRMGGGFGRGREEHEARLELPGYQLNVIRRRLKTLAYVGANVLGGEEGDQGMTLLVDDEGKIFVGKVVAELQGLVEKSNVGIIDLESKEDLPGPNDDLPPTATQQLTDMSAKSARTLDGYLRAKKGEPGAEAPAPADDAPAGDDRPDFN